MNEILKIKGLKTYFNGENGLIRSVDGIDISVESGEVLGLVGESGSGKTMTALSIIGMVPFPGKIVEGEILLEGQNIAKFTDDEMRTLRGPKIAMIFQDPLTSLNPVFSIAEQMVRPLMLHKKISQKEASARAVDMLKKVGIPAPEKRIRDYPHQFSGGQRQRIMIATALSMEPKLLIADEPTTALDVSVQAQILELLIKLKEESGTSMIFVSHNLAVVAGISKKVAVMYGGWIVEEAPVDEIFKNPLHPYTKALIGAIPTISGEKKVLRGLPGKPPSTGEEIIGCRLHPRCPSKISGLCDREVPAYAEISESHRVKCFLHKRDKKS